MRDYGSDLLSFARQVRQAISKFDRDADGSITVYVLMMFLTMVVAAGMAVDFTRQEAARAELQNALDRGTLAAADFAQEIEDKEMIVGDYVRSSSIEMPNLQLDVVESSGLNFSRVTASGTYQIDTFFLKIVGINQLTVAAVGAAEQQKRKVEISLVVDVSGSMKYNSTSASGTKLEQLQTAANEFIDTLITADTVNDTTMSIIPFSESVLPSRNLADEFNLNRQHNYANCFRFDDGGRTSLTNLGQYADFGISTTEVYQQRQRIKYNSWRYRCPNADNEIVALSNDASVLHDRINDLRPEGYTATWEGLKWATALLDPNSNSVVQGLIADGDVASTFADRPLPWNDEGVLKIIVVMTDGANTDQKEIKPWKYDDHSVSYWNSNVPSSSKQRKTIENGYNGKGDVLMHKVCEQARDAGAIVYTIGFELGSPTSSAAVALSQCASAPDNHFLVDGLEISSAFQVIAANIQKLKLIQ